MKTGKNNLHFSGRKRSYYIEETIQNIKYKYMEAYKMKNSKTILKNIIACLPESLQNNAMDILTCRYLSQHNAIETAAITGLSYNTVCKTLQAVKSVTKGKTPADFMMA